VSPLAAGIVGVSAYLAQEYVAAESLDLAIREYGPAPAADAVRVAAQLAGALDFAATVRIAHGALHPRDVLLSSEETRLSGVGVAHALERVGVVPPVRRPYTAPERIAGAAWDRRADVFSLAAMMHELLWGRRPTSVGAEAAETLTEIDGGDLQALRDAFARALAENPAERFQTALEFAEALNVAFPNVTLVGARLHEQSSGVRRQSSDDGRLTDDDRPSTVPAGRELRLPLDRDPDPTLVAPSPRVAEAVWQAVEHVGPPVDNVDLPIAAMDAGEEERYREVEAAPAMADPQSALRDPQLPIREPLSALERSRSAVWPLVLALVVGLAVGFAGGYGVGTHSRPDVAVIAVPPAVATTAAAPATAHAAPAASGREFTETAVAPAPKTPAPSATPPQTSPDGSVRLQPDRTAASTVGPGRLLVRSTPAGARVAIDGRDYGLTPAAVRDLTRGTYRVRVTRDGYAPAERRIIITSARPSHAVTFALARSPAAPRAVQTTPAPATPGTAGRFAGTLIVDSRPAGAKVYVDGTLAGTTPLSMQDVRAGEHAIRLEYDGYRRWSSSVRVVAAEQNRVTASLER
jgi:hypothetical protein